MGFSIDVSISAITVFVQGLLSFFSPCVLPLLPIYIGYLSGKGVMGDDGRLHDRRGRVMFHTVCFVVGISFAFFLLGLGVSAAGSFFRDYQRVLVIAGGILVILFGLYQLGLFGRLGFMGVERRFSLPMDRLAMSPAVALLMGFTFSFAWTPCVGPALTSVLLLAVSAQTKATGFALIGIYTLGFVIPFLAVGLFTTSLLAWFKRHRGIVRHTEKLGGVLMIVMGVLMLTGGMEQVAGYVARLGQSETAQETQAVSDTGNELPESEGAGAGNELPESEGAGAENEVSEGGKADAGGIDSAEETERTQAALPAAIDFELKDQYGNTHTLEQYRGKTIFLNFWATWCPPCRGEMPDIQALYEAYDTEGEEALIVLGVASPGIGQETDEAGITAFLEEQGYTYPVLMDTTGELFGAYGVYSLPTTYMIDREGRVFGYISGMLSREMMESIIHQTMSGERKTK